MWLWAVQWFEVEIGRIHLYMITYGRWRFVELWNWFVMWCVQRFESQMSSKQLAYCLIEIEARCVYLSVIAYGRWCFCSRSQFAVVVCSVLRVRCRRSSLPTVWCVGWACRCVIAVIRMIRNVNSWLKHSAVSAHCGTRCALWPLNGQCQWYFYIS